MSTTDRSTSNSSLDTSSSKKFAPISPFPIIKSALYHNLIQISSNNTINVDYLTLNITDYKTKPPFSLKIEGDIYFAYDISIPIVPYIYCDNFIPTTFKISNISITDIQYSVTNPNMYYFKLSINQVIQLNNIVQTFQNIRIYLSEPTPSMILTPNPSNTILFNDYTYKTVRPFILPQLRLPVPTFLSKYRTNFSNVRRILTETFTGFDIFGQFNLCKIDEFGLNSDNIYKIIYMNNSSVNNPLISNYYYSTVWADRYVTPQLSNSSLNEQSVISMYTILNNEKFINFTKDIKILAAPYKYSFINYQFKMDPTIILNILQNGFNVTTEPYNSLLDNDISTITTKKNTQITPITELNHNAIYVGQIYCNPLLFNSVMAKIKSWPKNSFEFNIAFFTYITYLMYDELNKTLPINISRSANTQNKILVFKITTPHRMNSPFLYRVDITTFLTYLTDSTIKTKLENYKKLTSTLSIDLPTALLLSYYDKNPQSDAQKTITYTPQSLLQSYYTNTTVLSNIILPAISTTVNIPIENVVERFDNININQKLNNKNENKNENKNNNNNNKINNQYIKYALI